MGQKIYRLAAGEKTPWMRFGTWSGGGLTFQGTIGANGSIDLETCNSDPKNPQDTPDDTVPTETITETAFSRTLYGAMAVFGRIKNTGATAVLVSFGTGYTPQGISGLVSEVGFAAGTSGRSNEMPS